MTNKRPFHGDASPRIFENARSLKRRMTKAEGILWERLRNRKLLGFKFRRQHPIEKFIVDFYCHERRLVIELDGNIHDREDVKERDFGREQILQDMGLIVIRFNNNEVYYDLASVLRKVTKQLAEPSLNEM